MLLAAEPHRHRQVQCSIIYILHICIASTNLLPHMHENVRGLLAAEPHRHQQVQCTPCIHIGPGPMLYPGPIHIPILGTR